MPTAGRFFLIAIIACFLSSQTPLIKAQEVEYSPLTSTVTANIPVWSINPPTLIAPTDESVTKNPYETFQFTRSTPGTYVDYYDLYLDDVKVAGEISHSALTQDAYFYTSERNEETITIQLKEKISDGYHYWRVIAYATTSGSASSDTWQFWVDSASPIIILEQVENTHLYWSTNDPYNIPPRNQRNFTVDTADPYLAGKVEAYSNLKLSLVCPENAPTNCQNQSITVYQPTGVWQHRFRGILEDVTYLVYIFATDAAGNTNSLPEFSLTYIHTSSIIETIFPTSPTPTITSTPSPTTPTPIEHTPTPTLPFFRDLEPSVPLIITPPEIPPPPPPPIPLPPPPTKQANLLTLIALFCLILHLTFLSFSITTRFLDSLRIISMVIIPFFFKYYHHLTATSFFSTKNKNHTLYQIKLLPFTKIYTISLEPIKNKLNTLKDINTHQLFSLIQPLIKAQTKYQISSSAGEFNSKLDSKEPMLFFANKPGFTFPPSTSISNYLPIIKNTVPYFGQIIEAKSTKNTHIIFLDPKSKDLLIPLERLQNIAAVSKSIPLIASSILCLISSHLQLTSFNIVIISLISTISLNEYFYPFMKTKQIEKLLNQNSR